MEADFEKTNDDGRERSLMLVAVLLIISVAVHIGLMLSVSDYSFTPMVENVHRLDQTSLRVGVSWLLLLPVLLLIIQRLTYLTR